MQRLTVLQDFAYCEEIHVMVHLLELKLAILILVGEHEELLHLCLPLGLALRSAEQKNICKRQSESYVHSATNSSADARC